MKISAVVVIYNEEDRLLDCLKSLELFEETIVIDIGSEDQSPHIARGMGLSIVHHPWVPIGEMVLPAIMPTLHHDWVIRVDPDEVLPPALIEQLLSLRIEDEYAIISLPYQYYFLNKKLDTTIWGGVRQIPRVVNRKKVVIEPEVHRALQCKPGYKTYALPAQNNNAVRHYWIDSYNQLFAKHERYIIMEGKSRYNNGYRFSWKAMFLNTMLGFKDSLIVCAGWRGGWPGWFLSFFYAIYEARSWLSLRRYEKNFV